MTEIDLVWFINEKLKKHIENNNILMTDNDIILFRKEQEKKYKESIRRRRNYMRNKEDNPEAHNKMLELRRIKYKQMKQMKQAKN